MNQLEKKVKLDSFLFTTFIMSVLSSLAFLVFFLFLVVNAQNLNSKIIWVIFTGAVLLFLHIYLIIWSIIFYSKTKNISSVELAERARFTYLWTIFCGFLFFVPIIVLRSYYLSGATSKQILEAKRIYEISIMDKVYKSALKNNLELDPISRRRIKNIYALLEEKHVTLDEKNTYLWEIFNRKYQDFIQSCINFEDANVINEIVAIIKSL